MRSTNLLLIGVLVTFAFTTASPAIADPTYGVPVFFDDTGHWYQRVDIQDTSDYKNWQDAKTDAEGLTLFGESGYLATITSSNENQFIVDNLLANSPMSRYWLGGFQSAEGSEPDGGWEWITGEPWNYANWRATEPNDEGGIEDVLETIGAAAEFPLGQWNDRNEDPQLNQNPSSTLGWIVEYNVIPEPSTLLISIVTGTLLLARRHKCKCAL